MAASQKSKDLFGMLAGAKPFSSGFASDKNNLKKQLDQLLANRPKYNIADEYGQNQALAGAQAFGRDRAIQGQENNIEQQSADSLGEASQVSSSTSSLLNTIGNISDSKNNALRGLATDEAGINRAKMQDLFGSNIAMGEEKDKAFDYNVNQPYQNKVAELRTRRKAKQENAWKIADTLASMGMSLIAPGAGSVKA
jgi:hypothetical protein